jgi:hypothetical protein
MKVTSIAGVISFAKIIQQGRVRVNMAIAYYTGIALFIGQCGGKTENIF